MNYEELILALSLPFAQLRTMIYRYFSINLHLIAAGIGEAQLGARQVWCAG
jgi:hypothetical protein